MSIICLAFATYVYILCPVRVGPMCGKFAPLVPPMCPSFAPPWPPMCTYFAQCVCDLCVQSLPRLFHPHPCVHNLPCFGHLCVHTLPSACGTYVCKVCPACATHVSIICPAFATYVYILCPVRVGPMCAKFAPLAPPMCP